MLTAAKAERIAWVARLLGHPLRVRLLAELSDADVVSPRALSVATGANLSIVSHHVRFLRDAGAIELVAEIPRRGALEHRYRASDVLAAALDEITSWRP